MQFRLNCSSIHRKQHIISCSSCLKQSILHITNWKCNQCPYFQHSFNQSKFRCSKWFNYDLSKRIWIPIRICSKLQIWCWISQCYHLRYSCYKRRYYLQCSSSWIHLRCWRNSIHITIFYRSFWTLIQWIFINRTLIQILYTTFSCWNHTSNWISWS